MAMHSTMLFGTVKWKEMRLFKLPNRTTIKLYRQPWFSQSQRQSQS